MDLHTAIHGRRAVRAYREQAIEPATVLRLIDAAVQAPSAMNGQPWIFTVVRDARRLDELSRAAKRHLAAGRAELARAAHLDALDDPDFHIFYHAPLLVLISARAESPWATADCALAAQNLMLAAHGEGLGSCWIGFAQSYLNTAAGKALLNLPADYVPVAPIIVGLPVALPPAPPRRPPDVHWVG